MIIYLIRVCPIVRLRGHFQSSGQLYLSINGHNLDWSNLFSATYIPDDSQCAKRIPIPPDQLGEIKKECFYFDD